MRSSDSRNGCRTPRTWSSARSSFDGPLFVLLAEDELDRLRQPAGRFGPPHFAVAAGADVLDQAVAGQRFDVDVDVVGHG